MSLHGAGTWGGGDDGADAHAGLHALLHRTAAAEAAGSLCAAVWGPGLPARPPAQVWYLPARGPTQGVAHVGSLWYAWYYVHALIVLACPVVCVPPSLVHCVP